MDAKRREVMRVGRGAGVWALLAAAGFTLPLPAGAAEWNRAAFEGKSLADAFKALGVGSPANSADVLLRAADIAENGAVVPINVESRIAGTDGMALLIEKNPFPLAAAFDIPAGTEANVTTRVKMAETCSVYALVRANGKFFVARKEIKVTLGGCGA